MYSNVNLKVLWIKNLANLLGFGASFVKKNQLWWLWEYEERLANLFDFGAGS